MAKIEDQRIIIWCKEENELQGIILDAVYFALKLEKEICLFANYRSEEEKKRYLQLTRAYAQTIKKDIPDLDVSTLVLKGQLNKLVPVLGEKYNVILFCCGGKVNHTILNAFYRAGFPFYFWKASKLKENRFENILIPIDFRNSTKDATLWGSYLGRFNESEIHLQIANDKNNNDLNQKVEKLVNFVEKFYGQFTFQFLLKKGKAGSWKIHKEALKEVHDFDLLIFAGSLNVTFIDRLFGPFEKLIVNRSKTPVIITNPQKEMYVLCN